MLSGIKTLGRGLNTIQLHENVLGSEFFLLSWQGFRNLFVLLDNLFALALLIAVK